MAFVRLGRGQSAIEQIVDAAQAPDGAEILTTYPPGTFYLFEATGQRKGSGSYYTPRQLAHFVVGETLRPLTENASPQQILALRICDPAMGSGGSSSPPSTGSPRPTARPSPAQERTLTISSTTTNAPPTAA